MDWNNKNVYRVFLSTTNDTMPLQAPRADHSGGERSAYLWDKGERRMIKYCHIITPGKCIKYMHLILL